MSFWDKILEEAATSVKEDPFLQDIMATRIFSHATFGSAMSSILARCFLGCVSETKWYEMFKSIYETPLTGGGAYEPGWPSLTEMGYLDLQAFLERDPATDKLLTPFLNYKGFKALQAHRIAHVLWRAGRRDLAHIIQALTSNAFAVDIHPAAVLGTGLMIDHGTGVVIGETVILGNNCSILHGVTLGSSGKNAGKRHPTIGNDVLIGCNATILGNIRIGDSCKIGSSSIVTKSIPDGATAVGNPARVVGKSLDQSSAADMDLALLHVRTHTGGLFCKSWSINADGSGVFEEVDVHNRGIINLNKVAAALTLRFHLSPPLSVLQELFVAADSNGDGLVDKAEFESISNSWSRLNTGMSSPHAVAALSERSTEDLSQYFAGASMLDSGL